jgi:hypothetical protein
MNKSYTILKVRNLLFCMLLIASFVTVKKVNGQTTISTQPTYSANNGTGLVTFNFQNTNAFPVIIIGASSVAANTNPSTWKLWYRTTPVSGPPGLVSVANGWVLSATNNVTSAIGSGSNNVLEPVITGATLTVPANTTYAIAVGGFITAATGGSQRYMTIPAANLPTTTFSGGGCNIITGTNISYSTTAEASAPTITPRGFVGSLTFISGATAACSTGTYPAVSPAVVSTTDICNTGSVGLSITATMPPVIGLTYQWEWSPTGAAPWTAIGAPVTNPSITATGVNSSRYFRLRVICDGTSTVWTSSNSQLVNVSNPSLTGTTSGSRCGPGIVQLSATAPTGTSINWYTAPTGGAPLFTGSPFTTPFIPTTTTFYAAGTSGSTPDSIAIPLATGTTTGVYHHMFLVEAQNSLTVNAISIKCNNTAGTMTAWDIYYRTDNYQTVPGANTSATGWLPLASVTNVPSAGAAAYTVIATGLGVAIPAGATYSFYIAPSASTTHQYSAPAIGTTTASNINAELIAGNRGSSLFNCTTSGGMPTVKLNYTVGCEGTRQPVIATVNASPAITTTNPSVICSNEIAQISLSTSNPPYPNYTWSPVTDLYTNAAATTSYTGGSAQNVYLRSIVAGQKTFYMMAGNPAITTGCTFADTVSIWVQPDSVIITGLPDTVCVSDSTKLSLVPGTGYAPGSIQWQESANGSTYNDIAGATGVTYTTPIISADHYYRVRIKRDVGFCETPVKLVLVVNPMIFQTKDSFNCGPGNVVLEATASVNSQLRWFNDPVGGLPVGFGSPFNTPFLAATDTFYVAAGTGGAGGGPDTVAVPLASGTTTGVYHHMFLVRAINEIDVAGFAIKCNNAVGTPTAWDIYYRPNNYQTIPGANTSAAGWTLLSSVTNVPSAGASTYTQIATGLSLTIPAGLTYSFYIAPVGSATHQYAASAINSLTGSNIDAEIRAGNRGSSLFNCSTSGGQATVRINYVIPGCETVREPVIASIHPVPDVNLGPDINKCIDAGILEVLDAGVQPHAGQYLWDNGDVNQVRAVSESGTYHVQVTNQYTCKNADTINVTLRNNPVVELGNDTTVCNGVGLLLNAGNQGIEYFWNTGATSQQIVATSAGSYNVFVTNNLGCTKADTITISMNGELPTIQGINVTNNGSHTFTFTAINPQHVVGFEWDFGDGTPLNYQQSPTHTYATTGDYIVVLRLSSTCGFDVDSSNAHILGINQLEVDKNEMVVYPNPSRGTAVILNRGTLKMEKVSIYNVLGQQVYEAKADTSDKHTLDLNLMASGMYTIQIFTDKGTVARKLELIK